ncbi:MAG: alpha/beta hydrolase [Proteobacteria bacterium]|nr:alpha/beta hydrolase [Pseudomonadota bacterium]
MLKAAAATAALPGLLKMPSLAASAAAGAPVIVDRAQQFDFVSTSNGRPYRIFVAKPAQEAPKGGYPVLYVLDGNAYFSTAAATAALQSYSPGVGPVLVVGIGYATGDRMEIERRRAFDLTLPAPSDVGMLMPGMTPKDFGGLHAFLQVIAKEIEPLVASMAPINPARTGIFGHSFGGLAVLQTLFQQPNSFRAYIAASPSIFWNDRAVLKGEAAFTRQVAERKIAPRVLITVGGQESALWKALPPGNPFTLDQVNALVQSLRMVDNARDLAGRLAAVKGAPDYQAVGIVYPDDGHLSEPPAALSRAVRFVLGPGL